jgi:hypothetical protein
MHTCTIGYCRNTEISSSILLSFSIYANMYTMKLSNQTLIYPVSYYCPPYIHTCTIWFCQKKHYDIQHHVIVRLHLYIPVQYDFVRRNTKISSSMLFSSINTYLYNMILSEETLGYPALCYCPSPCIHTCTIWYCQRKHYDIQHYVIVLLRVYIPVQYDIVRKKH